jgi:hypothetical protein
MPEGSPAKKDFLEKLDALIYSGLKPGMRSSELKQATARRRLFQAAGAILLVGLAALFYWILGKKRRARELSLTGSPASVLTPGAASSHLEVIDLAMAPGAEPRVITGKVKNNSGWNFSRVEVNLGLADINGSTLGVASATLPDVKSGSTVPFQVTVTLKNAALYFVRDVNGY